MKKRTFIVLVILFAGVCVLLFNTFYSEAKKTAIRKLNDAQMIHAKQAARGIEDFFATWTRTLASFSRMDEIIDVSPDGKRYMKFFQEAHQEQIKSITRMDERGIILYTLPFSGSIGSDISYQKHVQEILRDHKPVISDVFRAVQGFDAVALHVPVFNGAAFKGTIAVIIDFESLAKQYFDVIKIGETGYSWVISRDGTELYSPVPGFTGKSIFENCKNFPSIIAMAKDMLKGHEGTAKYTFDRIGPRTVKKIEKYAVYMPIQLGNTFWSVVVASAEQDVLSGLISFKNRLIIVIGIIFVAGILFSVLGAKAWLIVKEEEKRKQFEIELRDSERRYRLLFEQNPAPMLIYQRGTLKILAVNEAFTHHYGYTVEEAISLHLTDLYPEEEKSAIAELAARLKGHAYAGEWHHRKSDGSIINIMAISHDIDYLEKDARIAVLTDITDRKQAENALRYSEEKFFKAFHATPDAIIISRESDGLLIEYNNVFLEQTGYSREEVFNRTTVDLDLWVDPHDRDKYVAAIKEEGRIRDFESRFRTKSGEILDGLVSGERILLGNDKCLLTIIRDITEHKKTEAELEKYHIHLEDLVSERTEELKVAMEKAREADKLKSAFLAAMSHELRTPLNSIIGFTGILLQGLGGPLNEEQAKQMGMVQNSGRHLLNLINDVLDISKIEAGQLNVANDPYSLRDAVTKVVGLMMPIAEKNRVKISTSISGEVDRMVGDRRRLEQVLTNLLSNAIKFSPDGGEVEVHIGHVLPSQGTVPLKRGNARLSDEYVKISVKDNGIGIQPEDMKILFQPFQQIDTGMTRRFEGTGLGLSISKRLVEMMGGEIRGESEGLGRGSLFSFTLPIAVPQKPVEG